MEVNQRLTERLETITQYGPEDEKWHAFVRDHKKYLKRRSPLQVWTPELLRKYRYRPQDFYAAECHGPIYMTWIFLFVNDIRDAADFNETHTRLYMTPSSAIMELHQLYSTSENRNRE